MAKSRNPSALLRARWRVELAAVKALYAVLLPLPLGWRLRLGKLLGRAAFVLDRRHAAVALDNLHAAYPEAPATWRRRVARGSFEHLGRLLVEVLTERHERGRLGQLMRFEGLDNLRELAASGKGFFVLSGHFGNWEWVALRQADLGVPMWMVTRPLDNPFLERWLAENRSSSGNRIVHKRNALRELVKGLRAGNAIAFLADQNFRDQGAVFVPYFDRPAATTPALGALAARLEVAVLPVFSFPQPSGGYLVTYEPPIVPPRTGDLDADALAITREATRRLEAAVRRQPEAWFWMHRRWRHQPPGEPGRSGG